MMFDQSLYSEEELGLYNPAYTGFLLYSSISEFVNYKEEGMHCALPFIIIPIAMNNVLASRLPKTYRTPIASWLSTNEGALSDFPEQAEAYNPIVRASIRILFDLSAITFSGNGCLLLGENKLVKSPALFRKSGDMSKALSASIFLGKWFSHAPSTETVFAQLGIRP